MAVVAVVAVLSRGWARSYHYIKCDEHSKITTTTTTTTTTTAAAAAAAAAATTATTEVVNTSFASQVSYRTGIN